MRYSDILTNEHFRKLSTIFRSALSREWQRTHQGVPILGMWKDMNAIKTEEHFNDNRQEFVARFMKALVAIARVDNSLEYTTDDLDWFIGCIDSDNALAIASLFMAYAIAED